MKQYSRLIFSLVLTVMTWAAVQSQSSASVRKGKEPSRIGWGINIGSIGFANNNFQIGLTPTVAYRISETVSAGLMVKLDYYHQKYTDDLSFTAFNYGPTVFARWKPFWDMDGATNFMKNTFFQVEYEKAFFAREAVDELGNLILNDAGTKIKTQHISEDYLYLGVAFSSGYPFSTFVSFHYNVLDSEDNTRNPFAYRIGFTMNY